MKKWMIRVGSDIIEQADGFGDLGSVVTTDERSQKDIRKKIRITKAQFQQMCSIFTNMNLSMKLKEVIKVLCMVNFHL